MREIISKFHYKPDWDINKNYVSFRSLKDTKFYPTHPILVPCRIKKDELDLIVQSTVPLRAITPGQYIVFYDGEECVGGACIKGGVSIDYNVMT